MYKEFMEFAHELITTEDLDPVYCMWAETAVSEDVLKRWLLAYMCFYHCGVASVVAEVPSNNFYTMMQQAQNEKWPRGTERRHFRGQASQMCIDTLEEYGPPEKIIDYMYEPDTAVDTMERIREFPFMGPWISWKAVDLRENVLNRRTNLAGTDLSMYADPCKGCALVVTGNQNAKVDVPNTSRTLTRALAKQYREPPFYRRPASLLVTETVLCKFKSNYNGHYPPGKDTREIFEGLHNWGDLAEELSANLPRKGYIS